MIEKAIYDDFWFVRVDAGYGNNKDNVKVMKMARWCRDMLEENNGTLNHARKYAWAYERFPNYTSFTFDRESDAIIFALRWL